LGIPQNVSHGCKSLKKLSAEFLGIKIQEGAHSSVVDARASLALYRIVQDDWENWIKQKSAGRLANATKAEKEV
jgi:RNA exonuclease 4